MRNFDIFGPSGPAMVCIWMKIKLVKFHSIFHDRILKSSFEPCILPESSVFRLRREHCRGYLSVYENTLKNLLHLLPKSCHNLT